MGRREGEEGVRAGEAQGQAPIDWAHLAAQEGRQGRRRGRGEQRRRAAESQQRQRGARRGRSRGGGTGGRGASRRRGRGRAAGRGRRIEITAFLSNRQSTTTTTRIKTINNMIFHRVSFRSSA